jgi:hypothetical protein
MQNKKIFGIIIAVLAIGVIVAGGIYLYPNYFTPSSVINKDNEPSSDVVATVDGEDITLKDYKERLFVKRGGTPENPVGLDDFIKEPILNELVNQKIIEKELEKKNIVIPEAEISKKTKELNKDIATLTGTAKEAFRDASMFVLGQEKLIGKVLTWKEGYVLYCRFDNPDSKKVQKSYAKKYCQDMLTRLESGKSTYEKERKSIAADSKIGDKAWRPKFIDFGAKLSKNVPFITTSSGDEFEQIDAIETAGEHRFITVRGSQPDNKGKELSYAIVYLKDEGNTGETTDFEKWLKDKWKEYNVKTYIERVKI